MSNFVDTEEETTLSKFGAGVLYFIKNKYILTSCFFVVWMIFFAEKDIKSLFVKRAKYADLQQSEQHLVKKIVESKAELGQLKTDIETIEKYAREKYLMKKDNEDLFVLKEKHSLK
jgi:cell division protein DivIC